MDTPFPSDTPAADDAAATNGAIGRVEQVNIDDQMRSAYLDYAMSVIVARALPDARDGLKPVHRRILYSMYDMGIRSNSSFKKSARIVGEVLGKYHPHGDSAVYDAMARMAQDFSLRYLLVDGQGNFGSIHGDPPAAMRYTEARLTRLAEELLDDIHKDTVDWADNFDASLQEPTVLPGKLPTLLLNGANGIAVGMATNIPPHNLIELNAAIAHLIDHWDTLDNISSEDLMQFVPGPDFPTGGVIVGNEGIKSAYSTGRGRIIMRGLAEIEHNQAGRARIIIREIPYQVNLTSLIERIAELVREDRLDQISDLRDETDRRGLRIVIELKRTAVPNKVLNQLYKYTQLQSTFGVQMLALVPAEDGRLEPRTISLKRALQIFIDHRQTIIRRRSEFDLARARARAHILEGLLIAVANIDAIVRTIRESDSADAARTNLMTRFNLSEVQALAILDMQLRRIAALERLKIEEEYKQVQETISYLEDLLAHPAKILTLIKQETAEMAEKYGDARRTRIAYGDSSDVNIEDMIANDANLISITSRGYIKRTKAINYRAQGRGGKGVIGQDLREEEQIEFMFTARSLDTILFFTNKGKVYSEKAYEIPESGRTDKGTSLQNVLELQPGELITAVLPISDFTPDAFCTMLTRSGRIKRVALSEFASVRRSGLIAISLEENDTLRWARYTRPNQEVILVTERGKALRFNTEQVRAMGRSAAGVTAIRLLPGDQIASMVVIENPEAELLIVTANGYGKRTPISEYRTTSRATQGVTTINQHTLNDTGLIVGARSVVLSDELQIITVNGQTIRMKIADTRLTGRITIGTRLISLREGDSVASIDRLRSTDNESDMTNGTALPPEPEPIPLPKSPTE